MQTKAHRTFLANFKKYLRIDDSFENLEKILELENYFRENFIEVATKQSKDQILKLFKAVNDPRPLNRYYFSSDYKEPCLDKFILAYLVLANNIKVSKKDTLHLISCLFHIPESFYSRKNWRIIESKLKKYMIGKKKTYLDFPDYPVNKIAKWKSLIDIGYQNGVNINVSYRDAKSKKCDIEYCAPLYVDGGRRKGIALSKLLSYCLEKNYKIALNSQVNYLNIRDVKLPQGWEIADLKKFTELSLDHKMGSFRLELLKHSWYSNHVLDLITKNDLKILEKWWCKNGHEDITYANLKKGDRSINNFITGFLHHIKIKGVQTLTIAEPNVPYLIFYSFFAKAKEAGVKKINLVSSNMHDDNRISIDSLEKKSLRDLNRELNSFPEVRKFVEDLLPDQRYGISSYSSYHDQNFKLIKLIKNFRLRLFLILKLLLKASQDNARILEPSYESDDDKFIKKFLSEEKLLSKIERDLEFFKKFSINSKKILFSFLLKYEKNVFKKAVINDLKQKTLA